MSEDSSSNVSAAPAALDPFSHLRHDLRTPINQIIGYSEMLQEEAEDEGQAQYVPDLQKIQKAARVLLETINTNLVPGKFAVEAVAAPAEATINPTGAVPANLMPAVNAALDNNAEFVDNAEPVGRLLQGHVLAVDDNEMNRDMLARRLEKQGCTVTTAEDGLKALELLKAQSFDLVLLDIMMPGLDGRAVLQRLKADPVLRHIPVIMISALDEISSVIRCIEMGAEDFLPKPFNPTLLRARIGACLEKKQLRDQEQKTYQALVESQKHLAAELADAADYVESLLPATLKGPISTEWRFIPSTQLGGDAFGYHAIDPDHFAIYLLDVCGHGVGAALLSISAINVLRAQSLPNTDFRDPGQVLAGLNDTFQMDNQNNMYFTIWYGVYQRSKRQLSYASGGHPPAVLVAPSATPGQTTTSTLRTPGMVIGSLPGIPYVSGKCLVPPGSKLFVFSDGTYEITKKDGTMLQLAEYVQHLAQPSSPTQSDLDRLVNFARNLQSQPQFEDDFSVMRIVFE